MTGVLNKYTNTWVLVQVVKYIVSTVGCLANISGGATVYLDLHESVVGRLVQVYWPWLASHLPTILGNGTSDK